MVHRSRTPFVLALLWAVLLVLIGTGPANATAASLGATSYASNGAQINGWNWVRSGGESATWTFDVSTLTPVQKRSVFLNVNALVTNGVNGGSGFSAKNVKFLVTCTAGARALRYTVNLINPFRPVDPADSGGLGYAAYGSSTSGLNLARGTCTTVTVTTAAPFVGGRHIAFRADAATLGYRR